MSNKLPDSPAVADLTEEFEVVRATMKGTTYVLREVDMLTYEDLLKKAATGEGGRFTDNVLLLKLLVLASLQEPKLSAEQLTRKPTKVVRKLNDLVNDLHFGDIETDEEKAEKAAKQVAKVDEGDSSGEADVQDESGPPLI